MSPSPISVLLDSNEKGSDRAKTLALAVGGDPTYDLQGFTELPVDMRVISMKSVPSPDGPNMWTFPICNVELKEIPDFWASKGSGHLGQQVLEIVAQGQPGFVAVFGSLQEVLQGVPKMKMGEGKPRARSQMDITSDISTARAFSADLAACGVPVHFLSSNHEQSFRWILSYAKHILTGPNLSSWLPRFGVEPRGYGVLCAIPGIGDVAARGLLQAYGGIGQIAHEAALNFDGLAATKINGKALGPAKARKLAEVLG
jgi:hypothetical protein